jgi:hypothetical protein
MASCNASGCVSVPPSLLERGFSGQTREDADLGKHVPGPEQNGRKEGDHALGPRGVAGWKTAVKKS